MVCNQILHILFLREKKINLTTKQANKQKNQEKTMKKKNENC